MTDNMNSLNGVSLSTNGVSSISISNGGTGYSPFTQVVITGDGTDAMAVPIVDPSGIIISVQVINPGKNFSTEPSISFVDFNGSGAIANSTLGTGFLIKYGYEDFTLQSNWDGNNYEQHPNVPIDAVCFNDQINPGAPPTIWNGNEWVMN